MGPEIKNHALLSEGFTHHNLWVVLIFLTYFIAIIGHNNLRSFIASYIHLYAFVHRCFCNLRKSLARSCIHIFLAAGCADLGGDVTNNNSRLISGKCDRCGSRFSLSILANDTLQEYFLLVFISGCHLSRVGSLVCMNAIDKVLILHPRSPSVHFPVLYHRTKKYHGGSSSIGADFIIS